MQSMNFILSFWLMCMYECAFLLAQFGLFLLTCRLAQVIRQRAIQTMATLSGQTNTHTYIHKNVSHDNLMRKNKRNTGIPPPATVAVEAVLYQKLKCHKKWWPIAFSMKSRIFLSTLYFFSHSVYLRLWWYEALTDELPNSIYAPYFMQLQRSLIRCTFLLAFIFHLRFGDRWLFCVCVSCEIFKCDSVFFRCARQLFSLFIF